MRRALVLSIIVIMALSVYPLPGYGGDDDIGDNETKAIVPAMVRIPAGSFVMGDTFNDTDYDWMEHSRPTRTVNLDAYRIGRYEVTNRDYASILNWANSQGYLENSNSEAYTYGKVYAEGVIILEVSNSSSSYCKIVYNGSSFTVENVAQETHPVVEVSWYGAVMYCNWRSQQEGITPCYNTSTWECNFSANGYRLPTIAEWEKASGHDPTKGTYQSKRRYPWGDTWNCNKCNSWACGPHTSTEVGSYPDGKSYYECYDIAGNVWEWCHDWWRDNYTGLPDPDSNPTGPVLGSYRVLRGGGWDSGYSTYWDSNDHNEHSCRSATRYKSNPADTYMSCGFRIARTD